MAADFAAMMTKAHITSSHHALALTTNASSTTSPLTTLLMLAIQLSLKWRDSMHGFVRYFRTPKPLPLLTFLTNSPHYWDKTQETPYEIAKLLLAHSVPANS